MKNAQGSKAVNDIGLTNDQVKLIKSKYSATTTYCRHSGVKLIIGTEFQNSFLKGKLIAHSHYVFDLTTAQLLRLASTHLYNGNPTEQSLVTNAILHKLGVVTTTGQGANSPLYLDEKTTTRLHASTNALIKVWAHYSSRQIALPKLPMLVVNLDNCDNYVVIANAIKLCLKTLQEYSYQEDITIRGVDSQLERDYDNALNSEKQFQRVLDNYNAKTQPKKYTRKLGTWASKQLAIQCPDMPADKLLSINHYIQSDSNKLDNELLKQYIKLVEEELPMGEGDYETSHLVIRHLKSKLENINKELEDYGFIILEQEESLVAGDNETEGSGINYKTKTKVTAMVGIEVKVPVAKRSSAMNTGAKLAGTGSALARMMAKFKKAPTTAVTATLTTKESS